MLFLLLWEFGQLDDMELRVHIMKKEKRSVRANLSLTIVATLLEIHLFWALTAAALTPPDLELWRLDCGQFVNLSVEDMSDTFAYQGQRKTLSNGCYLIRHGGEYMLWDTGFSAATIERYNASQMGATMPTSLPNQLARIGIEPKRVTVIGVSHYHGDHTGQASLFPWARLLIGKQDFELLVQRKSPDITPWTQEKANLELISGDKDVFGDGSVIMLGTPGHTLGHHSLLVHLPKSGVIILTGDLWHFTDQVNRNEMPQGTADRAANLASRERITRIAANLKATIIIQHETSDIPKLPALPVSAR